MALMNFRIFRIYTFFTGCNIELEERGEKLLVQFQFTVDNFFKDSTEIHIFFYEKFIFFIVLQYALKYVTY